MASLDCAVEAEELEFSGYWDEEVEVFVFAAGREVVWLGYLGIGCLVGCIVAV